MIDRLQPAGAPAATILTAADERFARALWQMLRSAERHRLVEGNRWTAWDLGMSAENRSRLEGRFPWCGFETFDFSAWPPHVALAAGSYAWKPIIVAGAVEAAAGPVLWFDSATLFRGRLSPMLDAIGRTGVYALMGQAPMLERCDPSVLEKLDFPRRLYGTRERFAGLFGVDASRQTMRALVRRWRDLSLDPEIIRPAQRSIARHMNDQAVLSCLLLAAADRGEIELGRDDVDISSPRPIRFLSTRNKVPRWMPVAGDPLARFWYAVWKWADRRVLVFERRQGLRQAFSKWRNEHFAVVYRGGDGQERRVASPPGRYYADPFAWQEYGKAWILAEDFSYRRLRARIVAVPLDARLGHGKALPALDTGTHNSFPLLLRHDGRTWMIPESESAGGIDLYECVEFPGNWRKLRRLVDGVRAVDTSVFPHRGRWWLVTSLASPDGDGRHRHLAVFHSHDLLAGEWLPHPVNEAALYIEERQGTGRNAGAVLVRDGRIFRPMQHSRNFYGEGMKMMEIVALSTTDYREVPGAPPFPFEDIAGKPRVHHVSACGDLVAWDVRVR